MQGLPVARPRLNRAAGASSSSPTRALLKAAAANRSGIMRVSRASRRFRPSTATRRSWPKCIAALAKLGLPEDLVEKELGGHAAPYCTVVTTVLNITLCDTCVSRNDTRAPLLRRGSRRPAHATATRSLRRDRRPASPAGARELPSFPVTKNPIQTRRPEGILWGQKAEGKRGCSPTRNAAVRRRVQHV